MPAAPSDKVVSEAFTKEGLLGLINALPLAIAVIDRHYAVILANEAAQRFTNKKGDRLIGRVGGEALGCINHFNAAKGCGFGQACLKCKLRHTLTQTMEKGASLQMVETTMVLKNRGETHIRVSTLPMNMNDQWVVLLSIEDMTDAKKHEQTRMESEKLSAALTTAGAVCHEISQPLMVIMGLTELLLEDNAGSQIETDHLTELKKQTDRLGKITQQLRSITRYKTKPYLSGEILDLNAASE